jgi:hypothetical protein
MPRTTTDAPPSKNAAEHLILLRLLEPEMCDSLNNLIEFAVARAWQSLTEQQRLRAARRFNVDQERRQKAQRFNVH